VVFVQVRDSRPLHLLRAGSLSECCQRLRCSGQEREGAQLCGAEMAGRGSHPEPRTHAAPLMLCLCDTLMLCLCDTDALARAHEGPGRQPPMVPSVAWWRLSPDSEPDLGRWGRRLQPVGARSKQTPAARPHRRPSSSRFFPTRSSRSAIGGGQALAARGRPRVRPHGSPVPAGSTRAAAPRLVEATRPGEERCNGRAIGPPAAYALDRRRRRARSPGVAQVM
jgi:hypothetical protein